MRSISGMLSVEFGGLAARILDTGSPYQFEDAGAEKKVCSCVADLPLPIVSSPSFCSDRVESGERSIATVV